MRPWDDSTRNAKQRDRDVQCVSSWEWSYPNSVESVSFLLFLLVTGECVEKNEGLVHQRWNGTTIIAKNSKRFSLPVPTIVIFSKLVDGIYGILVFDSESIRGKRAYVVRFPARDTLCIHTLDGTEGESDLARPPLVNNNENRPDCRGF